VDKKKYPRTDHCIEIQCQEDIDSKEDDSCKIDDIPDKTGFYHTAPPSHKCWHCCDEQQPTHKSRQRKIFVIDDVTIEPSRYGEQ
jgi:hypothetical protein